jgi:hypothetical protein
VMMSPVQNKCCDNDENLTWLCLFQRNGYSWLKVRYSFTWLFKYELELKVFPYQKRQFPASSTVQFHMTVISVISFLICIKKNRKYVNVCR